MKITDDQNELFDIVDENDQVIGRERRGEAHQDKKLIHRSVSILVFNDRGELYLQKRSATKDTDPLKWTISCSGHVNFGDDYEITAHRELKEELGIDAEITFADKFLCRAPHETEMVAIFSAKVEPCRAGFNLNKEEISEGKFFTRKELNDVLKKGEIDLSFMGRKVLERVRWL
ncbi:NUDIX domain-containing protein [Candidatus Microgenomates bacterium]|nr:NUDIX domain-containing protein [Candidatus Microgenomates bacterium]